MTEETLELELREMLAYGDKDILEDLSKEISRVNSFDTAGVLSSNEGMVITFNNGKQFQISITRSR